VDVNNLGVDVILEEVVRELRAAGVSVRGLRVAPGELALQIGRDRSTIMSIVVHDRVRPSFSVSYPKRRNTDGRIETVRAIGLAPSRILSLARELEQQSSKDEPGAFGSC
jgi:hypothetical protein